MGKRKEGNQSGTTIGMTLLAPQKLWTLVPPLFKTAFWSACCFGIVTHIYMFTNLLLNHDSVWRIFYNNDNLASGRWSLQFLSEFSTRFQLPVVIAVISILSLALAAGFTVSVLEISERAVAILTSAFLVTIPSVACIFAYNFTADAYFICLFLNALAVYLAKHYSWGWLPAILLCAVACGGYQAFICYAIGLFLMDCILDLLARDVSVSRVLRKGVKYILISIAALVVYYVVLLIALSVTGVTLTSYQGLDGITGFQLSAIFSQTPRAYHNFIQYFLSSPLDKGVFKLAQILFFLFGLCSLTYLTIVRRIYRDWLRLALLIIGILLLPLALNFITLLSMGSDVHTLMIYSFVLLDVLILKLAESAAMELVQRKDTRWSALPWISLLLAGLLIWNNFCVSNIAYLRLQVCYENSFATANRIVARIESLEDYSPKLPVVLIGEADKSLYGGTIGVFSFSYSLTGIDSNLLYNGDTYTRTRSFIEHYIGLHMPKPSSDQKAKIKDSSFIKELPCYPAAGSIAVYEGMIVVKLGEGRIL